jgi:hypothetical protein
MSGSVIGDAASREVSLYTIMLKEPCWDEALMASGAGLTELEALG